MKNAFLSILFTIFLTAASHGEQILHVSPTGDDANPGTQEQPMRTIQHALDSFTQDERLLLLYSGLYEITEPIRVEMKNKNQRLRVMAWAPGFSDDESGNTVISAGRAITGWQEIASGVVVADVPEAKTGAWNFRDLYVNHRRAVRARHPNTGFFRVAQAGEDRRTNFTYNEGDLKNWDDLDGVELIFMHDWSITRCPIKEINESERRLTVPDKIGCDIEFFMIDNWEPHPRYFVENSRAFLDAPGEWFLDKKEGKLYYMLCEGETAESLSAVAPVAKQIMLVTGSDNAGEEEKSNAVHFQDIHFKHAAGFFPKPKNTYWGMQAAVYFPHPDANEHYHADPAAIQCENISGLAFWNCDFSHLGENGLWLGKNTSDCLVRECKFHDIGANGIMIGTHGPDGFATDCRVVLCELSNTCVTLYGGSSIWIGFAARVNICRNHIHDTAYSGISLGWQWNPQPSPSRNNRIAGNHIHDCMTQLSDAGCIYTLGWQPESAISDNLLHGVATAAGRAESNGMFLDEGTKGFTIQRNIVYDTGQSSLRFHRADKNVVKNNVLSNAPDVPMIRYNSTPEENIELIDNATPAPDSDELREKIEAWMERFSKLSVDACGHTTSTMPDERIRQ